MTIEICESVEFSTAAPELPRRRVAIVDYRLGNLFSVQRACQHAGLDAFITSSSPEVLAADGVILPGVGAFGDAITSLHDLNLATTLREVAARGTPLLGICLGLQLLLTESEEFGRYAGLDLVSGKVKRFGRPHDGNRPLKIPQVGWNQIHRPRPNGPELWINTPLRTVPNGTFQYFVHSYVACPEEAETILAVSRYGQIEFCAAIQKQNVFGFQFHPERSGPWGLKIYHNFATMVHQARRSS